MKLLLILAAFQADTTTITMEVSWAPVESTVSEAEITYALTDWPDSIGDRGWAMGMEVSDTTVIYELGVVYGVIREVCVKARHRLPPTPCPDCGEPVEIVLTSCAVKDYPVCRRIKLLYSKPYCQRYIP